MAASSRHKLIVGLGNPDEKYENTYHNVGSLFLAYLTRNARMKTARGFEYLKIGATSFMRPLYPMNESGEAVAAAIKYFKLKPEEVLVIQDDSDIELGKYKISFGRGSAGHRGINSIIKAIGTKDFSRLRLGVRKKESVSNKRAKAGDFVLNNISESDLRVIEELYYPITESLNLK